MPRPIRASLPYLRERAQTPLGRRVLGLALALLFETVLVLVLLTLGRQTPFRRQAETGLSSFDIAPPQEQPAEKPARPQFKNMQRPVEQPMPKPEETKPPPPIPLPPLIQMSAQDMAAADISRMPSRPAPSTGAKAAFGPAGPASEGDTPLMQGTGPNGEPLYAAQWYRKPYDSELSGYLSTASGPGWGLIACKTEPEYRVDNCVIVDEYPTGSRIANAVLQASWQFRVRPPRKGGKPLIGEWVGIRIDYGLKQR